MKIIKQKVQLISTLNNDSINERIEQAGRICYKSEPKDSQKFTEMLIKRNHLSVLEHVSLSFNITTNRGVSHELVRHRLASYSQESTRYCKYNELEFINPFKDTISPKFKLWQSLMERIEMDYKILKTIQTSNDITRSILPNSLVTRLVMTANIRQWRHIIALRSAKGVHYEMQEIIAQIYNLVKHLTTFKGVIQ